MDELSAEALLRLWLHFHIHQRERLIFVCIATGPLNMSSVSYFLSGPFSPRDIASKDVFFEKYLFVFRDDNA
jgi:hypothetical protein